METDPTDPLYDLTGLGLDDDDRPPDHSWGSLFEGIWRRITEPPPPS